MKRKLQFDDANLDTNAKSTVEALVTVETGVIQASASNDDLEEYDSILFTVTLLNTSWEVVDVSGGEIVPYSTQEVLLFLPLFGPHHQSKLLKRRLQSE